MGEEDEVVSIDSQSSTCAGAADVVELEVLAEGGGIFGLPKVGEDEDVSVDSQSSAADVVAVRDVVSLSFLMSADSALSTSMDSSGIFF